MNIQLKTEIAQSAFYHIKGVKKGEDGNIETIEEIIPVSECGNIQQGTKDEILSRSRKPAIEKLGETLRAHTQFQSIDDIREINLVEEGYYVRLATNWLTGPIKPFETEEEARNYAKQVLDEIQSWACGGCDSEDEDEENDDDQYVDDDSDESEDVEDELDDIDEIDDEDEESDEDDDSDEENENLENTDEDEETDDDSDEDEESDEESDEEEDDESEDEEDSEEEDESLFHSDLDHEKAVVIRGDGSEGFELRYGGMTFDTANSIEDAIIGSQAWLSRSGMKGINILHDRGKDKSVVVYNTQGKRIGVRS